MPFILTLPLIAVTLVTTGTAMAADGVWQALSPPPRDMYITIAVDDVHHRVFEFTRDAEVYVLSLQGPGVWTRVAALPGPSPRHGSSAIYDPLRERILVYGGATSTRHVTELWALSLSGQPTWARLTPGSIAPEPRELASFVYDPVHDRAILFGGYTTNPVSDCWVLPLAAFGQWRQINTTNNIAPRVSNACAYDAATNHLLVWSGSNLVPDLEALDIPSTPSVSATWVNLTPPTGPSGRSSEAFGWDPARRELTIYGGIDVQGPPLDDVWVLSLVPAVSWRQLSPTPGPGGRMGPVGAYDTAADRFVIFDGWSQSTEAHSDSWQLPIGGVGWSLLPASPDEYPDPAFEIDPAGSRCLTFDSTRLWALSTGDEPAWSRVAFLSGAPAVRRATILDPVRNRLVAIADGAVATLDLTNPTAWSPLNASGTPPAWSKAAAAYDPVRDRVIVFDGRNATGRATWQLKLSGSPAWSSLNPVGLPPLDRTRPVMVYDAEHDRALVYGGESKNDLWQLTLAGTPAWSFVNTNSSPPPAATSPGSVVDTHLGRMLVVAEGRVFALPLSGSPDWSELAPIGAQRPSNGASAMGLVYEPDRDRMLVHGGQEGLEPINRTFELRFSNFLDAPPPASAPQLRFTRI